MICYMDEIHSFNKIWESTPWGGRQGRGKSYIQYV
jgi:hypothetical protein